MSSILARKKNKEVLSVCVCVCVCVRERERERERERLGGEIPPPNT